ncbi:MAG: manganese efflux pump MntP [Candidatus Dormibacteraceae bacterium]
MIRLFALILPLAADTFAIAAALGLLRLAPRRRIGLSLMFAAFEGGMPVVGLAIGAVLGGLIGGIADYLAIAALVGLGIYLLIQDEEKEERRLAQMATSNGIAILVAGLAVSLDELAIGFTLGLLHVPVVAALILIGSQAFVVSQVGFAVGTRISEWVREGVERVAGAALIAIGGVILLGKFIALPF